MWEMKTEIQFSPAFAMATVHLDLGEEIQAEAGAMMAMTPGIGIETSTRGGVLKGLRRSVLGGESFFLNTFKASQAGDHVVVAPALPGDVITWPLTGNTVYLQSGSYLAAPGSIDVDSKWGGSKTFFSKEGLFMLKCSGVGDLVVSSYGAIQRSTSPQVRPTSSTPATWSGGTKGCPTTCRRQATGRQRCSGERDWW
jgi:uncharacterized protein (TIGR00266 family)